MSNNVIVFYHNHCQDGLMSAFCFRKKFPDATFYPAMYDGVLPPDVSDKEVYVVDFAYSREVMLDMKAKAKSLVVLDHHKSAMERLGDLDFCQFDMSKSGAGLSWDYLYPDKPRHWLVDQTEDVDLWRFKRPNSREVNCAIRSYPLTFETFDMLEKLQPEDLLVEGKAILRYQQNMVNDIAKKAYEVEIQGHKVLMVNSPVLQSEVGAYLSNNRPFGVVYFDNEHGDVVYSLRSKDGGEDVSKIAKAISPNGGGHYFASGVRVKRSEKL